jgi:nickel transport protein
MRAVYKTAIGMAVAGGLVAGLTASAAQAHAIWFASRASSSSTWSATRTALIYGIGADDLDMVKRLDLVRNVSAYDAQMKPVAAELKAEGPIAVVEGADKAPVITAVMYNKIWSKPRDGGEWVEGGREVLPNAITSEKNWKYAVYVRGPISAPLPAFPDQILQIVPVGPIPQKMGAPLKLRVLFKGRPASGAAVLTDFLGDPDAKPLKTAADGTVIVKVRNQGLNVINAVVEGPSDEGKRIDRIEYEATLSFALPHLPE